MKYFQFTLFKESYRRAHCVDFDSADSKKGCSQVIKAKNSLNTSHPTQVR